LDSAANLAQWLLRNRSNAEDLVQEVMLRAWQFFGCFYGGEARAWLLKIPLLPPVITATFPSRAFIVHPSVS